LSDIHTAVIYCVRGSEALFGEPTHIDPTVLSTMEEPIRLFNILLEQFLSIEDVSDSVELTCELLERFEKYFDISHVSPVAFSSNILKHL
jgi:hypothetical protein